MTIDLLWTTILDPRCRALRHLSEREKITAKWKLTEEVTHVYRENVSKSSTFDQKEKASDAVFSNPKVFKHFDFFDASVTTSDGMTEDKNESNEEQIRSSALREVENYLDPSLRVNVDVKSLDWWKVNRSTFPHISQVARKWLSVIATSTPSERVFSDCGLALTAKRSKMKGDILQDQVMIRRNINDVDISFEDILEKFKKN